ncbi:MAG TPA: EamA family transporter [Acidimicrobiia bacterium]|nr:EamA family transporter [Acidimicrobiia bacterium]
MPTDHTTRATLQAVFVTILWASSWVLIRIGLDSADLQPLGFAGMRYGLAALVIWATVVRRSGPSGLADLTSVRIRELIVLGIVFYALTQGAQFVAIANQPAATTSLVLSFTPLLAALVGMVVLGEHVRPIQVVGMVAVAAGAFLYFTGSLGATAVGMAASLVCLGSNTAAAILGRRVNRRTDSDPLLVTAVSMSIGAAVLLIVGAVAEGISLPSPAAWLIIAWLAVVNTAWAFVLWNRSLVHLPAATSAVINNLMLVEIAVLAWLFLDERPSVGQVVAIAVVTTGVVAGSGAFGGVSRRSGGEQSTSPPPRDHPS